MIHFGRGVLGDAERAARLEWLVTNGIGGFACGTVSGELTRRYHGLLLAALRPPVERQLLLVKLGETLALGGATFALDTNRWASGALAPAGHVHLESFALEDTVPCWTWAVAGARLEKRVWMEPGENHTWIEYRLTEAPAPARLMLDAYVNARDIHAVRRLDAAAVAAFQVTRTARGVRIAHGDVALALEAPGASFTPAPLLYREFALALEAERGLEAVEDHVRAAVIAATLAPGDTLLVSAAAEAPGAPRATAHGAGARVRRRAHEARRIEAWRAAQPRLARAAPEWIRQLVLAADQFVVGRARRDGTRGVTVMAGYPWFTDWGRDTMIALPGLALVTGRPDVARGVLETFASYVDGGMLPNVFDEAGDTPAYDSVDAPLWLFQAGRAYAAGGDGALLVRLAPALEKILAAYERGTRHGIGADPADGLLRQGEPGVALTWMDARANGAPVTPRIGKPVEINVLWHAALVAMASLAPRIGRDRADYVARAERVRESFTRFWNPATGHLFDVLGGPGGDDATLRPNQLFALSIEDSPLDPAHRASVLAACERALATSYGIRTGAPGAPGYHGRYLGDRDARDRAYHQGTAWTWLLPQLALARLAVHGDREHALAALAPLATLIAEYGLGSLPEIVDGDPPHAPRGCFAQAWSVGEALRAWHAIAAAPARRAARTSSPRAACAPSRRARARSRA